MAPLIRAGGDCPFLALLGATNGSMSRQTAAKGESMKSRDFAGREALSATSSHFRQSAANVVCSAC